MNSDFTQGSIFKKLIAFMIPVLGALVLQAAYGAVDLLVVGRFGTTEGLSAVSTGSQVLNLVTFVITQFAMGITVLIARYIGEKTRKHRGFNWWCYSSIWNTFCILIHNHDIMCIAHFNAHAGAFRSAQSYIYVCKNMWWWYFLYCGLQCIIGYF